MSIEVTISENEFELHSKDNLTSLTNIDVMFHSCTHPLLCSQGVESV